MGSTRRTFKRSHKSVASTIVFVGLVRANLTSKSQLLFCIPHPKYILAKMEALCCCGLRQRARTDGSTTNASFLSFRSSRDNAFASNTISQARSGTTSEQVSPSEGPIELCRIARDESELAPANNFPTSFRTSTFEGMKAKLIKHISNDGDARRQSRVSIGHSDIELARRAEVRRLQQKRIQDELEKGDPCDDCSDNTNHSARYLSPFIDVGSPRIGPRDAIEFSVESGRALSAPKASPGTMSGSECCSPPETSKTNSLRESNQYSAGSGHSDNVQDASIARVVSRVNSQYLGSDSIRCISPLAMTISPRNSYPGCPTLDRIIGKDNEFNIRHGSHAWEDQSALGIWLLAQDIKSQDNSIPEASVFDKNNCSTEEKCGTSNDQGAVDRATDSPTKARVPIPTHEGVDDTEDKASLEVMSQDKICPDIGSMGKILASVGHGKDGQTCARRQHPSANDSSTYPSVMPSFQPSPKASDSNGYILSQGDLENLEFSPFQCISTPSSPMV